MDRFFHVKQFIKRRLLPSRFPNYCPLCETQLRFLPFGVPPRDSAQCPQCGSLERHRLLWLILTRHTDLFDGKPKTLLHVAPEECIAAKLRQVPALTYVSTDLSSPTAMVHTDLMQMAFQSQTFDVVYCSHVLEHVRDDHAAMRECWRIMRPTGWGMFLVPIVRSHTHEDPGIVDPHERARVFGQSDHVRAYGPDFKDRLDAAGFVTRTMGPSEVLTHRDGDLAVTAHEWPLYHCTRADNPELPTAR